MRYLLVSLVLAMLSIVAACNTAEPQVEAVEPEPSPTPAQTPTPTPPAELSWEDIVDMMEPSTVMIRADFPTTAVSWEGQGSGTGIVYSDDGYIITNAHVVDGAAALTVSTSGSPRQRSARFVGVSPCDDLAVIQISDMDGLGAASLGDSSEQRVGADVATLGYPLGEILSLDISFNRGVIGQMNDSMGHYERLIQHDATVNNGNSGGPLVNRMGEVIGVNSLFIDPDFGQGMYWAIDINQAKPIIDGLEQGNNRLWHGMNLTSNLYPDYFGTEEGLVVAAVASGSSASSIGVQPAFLLTHLEGLSITSMEDVCRILRSQNEGDSVRVEFMSVTDLGYDFWEGEVVLGESDGKDLELIWSESFAGQVVEEEGEIDDTAIEEVAGETTDDQFAGLNTDVNYQPAEYAGTATLNIWEFAECGPDEEWEQVYEHELQIDVRVILDYPYEDVNSNAWFTMFSEHEEPAGFWIRSSWLYDNGDLIEYWDIDFDGVEMHGMLIDEIREDYEEANVLYDILVSDPCGFDDYEEIGLIEFFMRSEETYIDARFFGGMGVIEIWGMTADWTRDFEIHINVNEVTD